MAVLCFVPTHLQQCGVFTLSAGRLSHQIVVKQHHEKLTWNWWEHSVPLMHWLLSAQPQWVRSLVDTATFFQPPFPLILGFFGGGNWGSCSLPSSPGKPVVVLTTSHLRPHRCRRVFHISRDHSSSTSLNQSSQWTSSYTRFGMYCFPHVLHVNLSNMLHAKSLL